MSNTNYQILRYPIPCQCLGTTIWLHNISTGLHGTTENSSHQDINLLHILDWLPLITSAYLITKWDSELHMTILGNYIICTFLFSSVWLLVIGDSSFMSSDSALTGISSPPPSKLGSSLELFLSFLLFYKLNHKSHTHYIHKSTKKHNLMNNNLCINISQYFASTKH